MGGACQPQQGGHQMRLWQADLSAEVTNFICFTTDISVSCDLQPNRRAAGNVP